MPKLSADRLPRYCRHKQAGQAVVYLDGQQVLLGTFNSAASRERYNAVIAEWLANGRHLPYLRVANVKRSEIDLTVVKDVSIAEDEIER